MYGGLKTEIRPQKMYNIRNNQLDIYANVPYAAITAFPSTNEQNEITRKSLISENTSLRQELFIKETELQELQMKFESLQTSNTEKGKQQLMTTGEGSTF